MGNGFTVEAIVAQIRSRIAEENARKSNPSQTRLSVSEGPVRDVAGRRQRMEEDTTRFADLDLRLENAARNIGQQPLAPPTWRGRLGAWIVQGLRRLLWWYGLPIKEAVAQIGLRNREQAIRHRYLQEDLLALSENLQRAVSRIDGLEQAYSEAQSLQRSIADFRTRVGLLEEQVESRLNDLQKSQDSAAKDAARRLQEMLEDWSQRDRGVAQQITALNDLGNRIEQVSGALAAQVQAEARAREVLAGVVNDQGDRIEQVNGALFAQLQAEVHTREILAGVVNGQAGKLQQVTGALEPLASLPSRVSSLAVTHEKQRSSLLLQENRIAMFLPEVRHQPPKPLSKAQEQQFTEASTDAVSALYAEFEDTFRGPRELIKERQEVYVPRLTKARVGSISDPVLDLGCGRGEWLELLADHHLVASGVDSDPGMIERCRALGINVTLGDALTHLRGLPDRSVGAVTSFHMVEHMPFETVIALLDEALRVLRTGGLLIFETPNPQNVLVGSQTFWIDPTHLKPIPSQTLRFFVEARGFCDAEVWNLQPYPEAIRLPEDPAGIGTRFNDYFYGPQDYGIIACRP
jgi:SAM-dependent methyltransferase